VVALPLAMGMGVTSGTGPIAGIYGAIFVGLFAALFGGTPAQVSGPTGLYPDDPAQGAAIAFTVVMLGGAFQILFGILKLGRFISLIPHPVVSGFMTGIGVIILLQLQPLIGALHALVLLAIVLGLGSLALYIPKAVLAGILIKVGVDIIDWEYLKQLPSAPRSGVLIMLTVFGLTVFVDLIMAVAIGMVMAAFVFMQRMTDLQLQAMHIIRHPEDDPDLAPREAELLTEGKGRILLYKLSGPRSFTSAKHMVKKLSEFTDYDALILDMHEVTTLDYSSSRAIDEILEGMALSGRHAIITGASEEVDRMLEKLKAKRHLRENHQFDDREQALETALTLINED